MVIFCISSNRFFEINSANPGLNEELRNIYKSFKNIKSNLENLEWNKARVSWIEINKSPGLKNSCYDCFNSEYDAYIGTYIRLQEYTWKSFCQNTTCESNKIKENTSTKFVFK